MYKKAQAQIFEPSCFRNRRRCKSQLHHLTRTEAEEVEGRLTMEDDRADVGDEFDVCRVHPNGRKPPQGVCPACLIDRLACLCPDCAQYPPCDCLFLYPSSLSSSSFPSSLHFQTGPNTPFSQLSDDGPPTTTFRRSLSSALSFLRPCHSRKPGPVARPAQKEKKSHKWSPFWSNLGKKKKKEEAGVMHDEKRTEEETLLRSKSVGVGRCTHATGAEASGGAKKWCSWRLPGPINAFRRTKRTARVAHQESPLVADIGW